MTDASHAQTTAHAAASYFVSESQLHGDPITNLKLQKLLYYAQGWFLALYGRPLFYEPVRAWIRGPVVQEVWQTYKEYRWSPIEHRIRRPNLPELVHHHLDQILQVYGDYSALTLERMTHDESPWLNAREHLDANERSSVVIPLDDMRAYFTTLANASATQ